MAMNIPQKKNRWEDPSRELLRRKLSQDLVQGPPAPPKPEERSDDVQGPPLSPEMEKEKKQAQATAAIYGTLTGRAPNRDGTYDYEKLKNEYEAFKKQQKDGKTAGGVVAPPFFGTGIAYTGLPAERPPLLNAVQNPGKLPASTSDIDLSNKPKQASDMSNGEMLKMLLNDYFTPAPYTGLTDSEISAIKDRLSQQASRTEQDVMGKYAAATGGIPSTAAVSAAAKAGSDVMSQLQDIVSQQDSVKYDRWRNQQTDAYNRLNTFFSMNGSDKKTSTTTSSPSNTTATTTGTGEFDNWIDTYSPDGKTPIGNWNMNDIRKQIEEYAKAGINFGIDADTFVTRYMPTALIDKLDNEYPDDAPLRMMALINYLYENNAMTGAERKAWMENSGLQLLIEKLATGKYQ